MTKPAIPLNALNAEKIAAHCAGFASSLAIEVVAQTGSTNSDLMARLPAMTNPTLLIAEHQTAGRGRAGRSWLGAPGSTLTFSLAWPFTQSPHVLMGLPLAVGVGITRALASLDVSVQLKWPNDILKEGKKLAGILIETAQPTSNTPNPGNPATWAVIGVGLNLRLPEEVEAAIGQPVAEATWLAQMDRNQLLATLINHLVTCLNQFSASGFSSFVPEWNQKHAYAGQHVCLIEHDQIIRQGIALGVDNLGCLLLQDQHGVIWPIMAGDVSLRPLPAASSIGNVHAATH